MNVESLSAINGMRSCSVFDTFRIGTCLRLRLQFLKFSKRLLRKDIYDFIAEGLKVLMTYLLNDCSKGFDV